MIDLPSHLSIGRFSEIRLQVHCSHTVVHTPSKPWFYFLGARSLLVHWEFGGRDCQLRGNSALKYEKVGQAGKRHFSRRLLIYDIMTLWHPIYPLDHIPFAYVLFTLHHLWPCWARSCDRNYFHDHPKFLLGMSSAESTSTYRAVQRRSEWCLLSSDWWTSWLCWALGELACFVYLLLKFGSFKGDSCLFISIVQPMISKESTQVLSDPSLFSNKIVI